MNMVRYRQDFLMSSECNETILWPLFLKLFVLTNLEMFVLLMEISPFTYVVLLLLILLLFMKFCKCK